MKFAKSLDSHRPVQILAAARRRISQSLVSRECWKLAPLAAIALLGSLSACAEREPDARGVDRDETLLTVSATGRAENQPDEARFTAGIQTIRPSAAAANQANTEAMEKLIAALKAQGVVDKDLRTQTISVNRIGYGKQDWMFDCLAWSSGVATLLEINHVIEARLHVCHMMSDRTVELIRRAKADGDDVTSDRLWHQAWRPSARSSRSSCSGARRARESTRTDPSY